MCEFDLIRRVFEGIREMYFRWFGRVGSIVVSYLWGYLVILGVKMGFGFIIRKEVGISVI